MSNPKVKSDAPDQLAIAFAELDKVGTRLDALKKSYNATAKELSELQSLTPVPPPLRLPTPIEAIPVQPVPVVVEPAPGRYSSGPLKSERPMAPRPVVPRPTPRVTAPVVAPEVRPKAVPPPLPNQRRHSGRFYIQVGTSPNELREVREKVAQFGRIVDSGVGTAADPQACWLEVAVRDGNVASVAEKLYRNDLQEVVEKVIQVEPGEGRLQARQLELFRLKKAR